MATPSPACVPSATHSPLLLVPPPTKPPPLLREPGWETSRHREAGGRGEWGGQEPKLLGEQQAEVETRLGPETYRVLPWSSPRLLQGLAGLVGGFSSLLAPLQPPPWRLCWARSRVPMARAEPWAGAHGCLEAAPVSSWQSRAAGGGEQASGGRGQPAV